VRTRQRKEDVMNRRGILAGAFTAVGSLFAASKAKAAAAVPDKLKVVYHLADLDKVSFVLGNIKTITRASADPSTSPSRWSCTARH